MDRVQWYFRQRVTNPEMNEFQDNIERSTRTETKEILGFGIVSGGSVAPQAPVNQDQVLVGITISRDKQGRRVNVQNKLFDTVSCIVRGLTLQLDGIGVPNTAGTYILFTSQPPSEPFNLVGQSIELTRSQFPGNNNSFVIQQVVTTDWGGLIPSQIMVRIDEELDPEGYTAGLSPRGTTVISRIESAEPATAVVGFDDNNLSVKPINPGNERWVSLYAKFDRFAFDQRLDGNAAVVQYQQVEYYDFSIEASEPEALIGTAVKPALRTNGDILIADIRLENSANIQAADILIDRQVYMFTLSGTANQVFKYANIQTAGGKVAWDGSDLSTNANTDFYLPDVAATFRLASFTESLADGEVLYADLPVNAIGIQPISYTKVAQGGVPAPDQQKVRIIIAMRAGTKVLSSFVGGELEAGEEHDIGDSLSDDILALLDAMSETVNGGSYSTVLGGGSKPNTSIVDGEGLQKSLKRLDGSLHQVPQVKAIDLVTTVLPATPAVTLDGVVLANGDLVFFAQAAIEGLYRVSNIGVAAVFTKLFSFGHSDTPLQGARLHVSHGSAYLQGLWRKDANGWRQVDVSEAMGEATGFLDLTTSEFAFVDGTRTFSINPKAPATFFDFYLKGKPFRKTAAQSVVIPDTEGLHEIYFDSAGVLQSQLGQSDDLFSSKVHVATIYWDALNDTGILIQEQRHGMTMDGRTQQYLQTAFGLRIASGFDLTYSLVGTGALAADSQVSNGVGAYQDEDLTGSVPAETPAQIPVFYRDATGWRKNPAGLSPLKLGAARPEWNNPAGPWTLVEAASGEFVPMFLMVTNDINEPLIAIMGQSVYPNLGAALASLSFLTLDLTGLPKYDMKSLYALVYETQTAYVNPYKAALRYVRDLRGSSDTFVGGGITDHGALSGLNDPDHGPTAVTTAGVTKDGGLSDADVDLAQSLDTLNKILGQLRLKEHPSNPKRLVVTGATRILNDGTKMVQKLRNLLLSFDGAEIDFDTKLIYEADGVTPFANSPNFAYTYPTGVNFKWLSITLLTSTVSADNQFTPQFLILEGSNEAATADLANKPVFGSGTSIGAIFVQGDGGGNIAAITQSNVSLLGSAGGGSGSGEGDANEFELEMRAVGRRLAVEWVRPVIAAKQTDTLIDDANSDAVYDVANNLFSFPLAADELRTLQLYGSEFLASEKASRRLSMLARWNSLDPAAIYEISNDNGLNWNVISMERHGATKQYFGTVDLPEPVNTTTLQEYAVGNADATVALTDLVRERAVKIVLTQKQRNTLFQLYYDKTGTPVGNLFVNIKRDNAGEPGEVMAQSAPIAVSSLSAGPNALPVAVGGVLPAGTYWVTVESDSAYRASYVAATHQVALRSDSSGGTYAEGDSYQYDGTTWTQTVGQQIVFLLAGHFYVLLARITSSVNDVSLVGFGVYFGETSILTMGVPQTQTFRFSGDLDQTQLEVTNFLPDPDFVKVEFVNAGLTFVRPFFDCDGKYLNFKAGTFLYPGVDLIVKVHQLEGNSFDYSNENAALLAANGLGSTDPTIDRSSAGVGLKQRSADGTLWHLQVQNDGSILTTAL